MKGGGLARRRPPCAAEIGRGWRGWVSKVAVVQEESWLAHLCSKICTHLKLRDCFRGCRHVHGGSDRDNGGCQSVATSAQKSDARLAQASLRHGSDSSGKCHGSGGDSSHHRVPICSHNP